MVGSGGTLVELVDDTVSLLLPVHRSEIESALHSLKAAKLATGFRGGRCGDLGAAVDAVEALARYAMAHAGELAELEVNPLLILPEGAVAVDALIRKTES